MTVAMLSAAFPQRPPTLNIHAAGGLKQSANGCGDVVSPTDTFSGVIIDERAQRPVLFPLNDHENKRPKSICRFTTNSVITVTQR